MHKLFSNLKGLRFFYFHSLGSEHNSFCDYYTHGSGDSWFYDDGDGYADDYGDQDGDGFSIEIDSDDPLGSGETNGDGTYLLEAEEFCFIWNDA